MAKAKSVPAPKSTVENTEAVVAPVEVVSPREKAKTSYIVCFLPPKRDRLSPQVKALVQAIDENQIETVNADESVTKFVQRSTIYEAWAKAIGSESGEKVFASYMHQLLSYGFLERMDGGEKKAKKVTSPEDRKKKLLEMLAKLPEADRKALLAEMAG